VFHDVSIKLRAKLVSALQPIAVTELPALFRARHDRPLLDHALARGVEGHLDRAVSHELLDALRIHAVLDPQGGAGVPQGVHPVLRPPDLIDHASGHLDTP
jgi:hypothetical protein